MSETLDLEYKIVDLWGLCVCSVCGKREGGGGCERIPYTPPGYGPDTPRN